MLERLKQLTKNGVNRVAETLDTFRKDIFDLEGVPAYREFYTLYIFPWKYVYRGYYAAWHNVPLVTIDKPKGQSRRLMTLNAGKMAAAQLARYEWNEKCKILVNTENSADPENDPLNRFIHAVLKENSFDTAFGEVIEKCNSLGGAAIKEWAEVPKDADGNDAGPARIRLSFHMADQFIPTRWNNHQVKEGLFLSREAKDGYYYSTVEWHRWEGTTYRVTNEVYRMPISKAPAEPQNILGWWYPLNMVYPLLSPSTEFHDLGRSMFQYIRPFGANYADDNSPLGMSVYSTAMDTLHSLDIAFDSFNREFVLGKKRIIVPARAIRNVVDPTNGRNIRYFDANDEVYEALATDDTGDLQIHDNTVELRVDEHVVAINALLSILCAQTGMDPGILSFDKTTGLKTATEVISQNSKTFSTVKAHENSLRPAIEDMIDSIITLAMYYDVEFEGQKIATLAAGGYQKSVTFDDSIIEDRTADINEGILLASNALMSKMTFMMERLGYTEDRAKLEIQRIQDERKVGPEVIDRLDDFGA